MKHVKHIILIMLILASLFSVSACVSIRPYAATENLIGKKVGTAETVLFLGISGDDNNVGILKAAKNGGITRIATVDIKSTFWLFGITLCYTVTGE